jgi:RNA polymerase sigma-70 factor (ECF subfamily)
VIGKLLAFRHTRELASSDISDEALLAACATGDRVALGVLFDRHHVEVHRFLVRLSFRHSPDVEDLLQATFMQAQRSARGFQGRSSVRTWLMAVAANMARHHDRAEGRRRSALDGLLALPLTSHDGPGEVAERSQMSRRLAEALASLEDRLRAPFVLCDVEGISNEEAARALGIRVGTIWRRLHDARERLREAMKEEVE